MAKLTEQTKDAVANISYDDAKSNLQSAGMWNPTGSQPTPDTAPTTPTEPTVGDLFGNQGGESAYETEQKNYMQSLDFDPRKVRREIMDSYQGEIDQVKNVYGQLLRQQQEEGRGRLGETTAVSARRGLLGSSFGTQRLEDTRKLNLSKEEQVLESQASALANVMARAEQTVRDEIASRRAAKEGGYQSYLEYLRTEPERKQQKATNFAKLLIGQGLDPFDPTVRGQVEDALKRTNLGVSTQDILAAYLDNKPEEESGYMTLSEGQTVFDPVTGEVVYTAPKTYKPTGSGSGGGSGRTGDVSDLTGGIIEGYANLKDLTPSDRKEVIEELYRTGKGNLLKSKIDQYGKDKAQGVLPYIDDAIAMVENEIQTGISGKAQSKIWGTNEYNYEKLLDTINAAIAFGELTDMRAASPTGGALGQVSERELALLSSVKGSLDIGQDKEIIKQNLNRIRESFQKVVDKARENEAAMSSSLDEGVITAPDGTQVIIVEE